MAFSAVWVAIASIIYCFDIKKAVDESGNVIEPSHEYLSALTVYVISLILLPDNLTSLRPHSFPKPFKCSIKPRSDRHERAIRSAVLENEFSETA
jgi:hypothetical protein